MMEFWSNHFFKSDSKKESSSPVSSGATKVSSDSQQSVSKFKVRPCQPAIPFQDRHPFLTRELLPPKSRKAQALLADFRARGATVRRTVGGEAAIGALSRDEDKKQTLESVIKDTDRIHGHDEEFVKLFFGSQLVSSPKEDQMSCDSNKQPDAKVKFPILYSNYSAQTKSESSFCVYPSSIVMELSGTNCLTLGSFLDNYCFRSDYKCPNNECKSIQLTDHIRKFCYSNGSVCLTLKSVDTEPNNREGEASDSKVHKESKGSSQEPVSSITSSTFCDTCNYQSNFVPLSEESISMSFAKFLMLRICGQEYIRRMTNPVGGSFDASFGANSNKGASIQCSHQSFLRQTQFFIHKNLIASFEYNPINVRSIFLPPVFIKVKIVLKPLKDEVCEELKKVSVRGWESHGSVHDKVTNLRDEIQVTSNDAKAVSTVQMIQELIQLEEKDRSEFRRSVEQIQVDICSKNQDIESMYQVMNSIFFLKRQIVNFVNFWNAKINELNGKRRNTKSTHGSSVSLSRLDSTRQVQSLLQSSVIPESTTTDSFDVSDDLNRSDCSNDVVFKSVESVVDPETSDVSGMYQQRSTLIPLELDIDKISLTPSERSGDDGCGINPILGDDGSNTNDAMSASTDGLTDESYAVYRTLTEADKHLLDEIDSKRQAEIVKKSKAASSKTSLSRIIEQFRPGIFVQEFENPFSTSEHYSLPVNEDLPVLVRDDDAGSMIAFTLASHEYDSHLRNLGHPVLSRSASQVSGTPTSHVGSGGQSVGESAQVETSYDSQVSFSASGATFVKSQPDTHDGSIEVQFEDSSIKFSCTVYFADRFRKLRSSTIKLDISDTPQTCGQTSMSIEEMFIRSLSTAFEWKASGGKSGSRFRKTLDDRFIIKEMNTQEVASFKLIAKKYFDYIEDAIKEGRPTALAKVLGVYKVNYKSIATGTTTKMYVLVIENLFYGRNITQKFDLKGSGRNRLANLDSKKVSKSGVGDEVVLLDTNLVQLIRDSPLYVKPEEKRFLQGAIDNDSTFLTSLDLLDYSLLVGIDDHADMEQGKSDQPSRGQLVVGIIDYIRSYTWDKKLESAVKSSISGKEPPTIVKPELYKERFLNRMNQYFLSVPNSDSKIELLESSSTVIVL